MLKRTLIASLLILPVVITGSPAFADKPDVYRSPGKPGAPVDITYHVPQKAGVGESLDLGLQIQPRRAVDSMSVDVRTDAGLALDQPNRVFDYAQLKAGLSQRPGLRVIPQGEGMHYVTVTVTTRVGNLNRASVVMIPVAVGNVTAKPMPAGKLKQTDGQLLETLPAEESSGDN